MMRATLLTLLLTMPALAANDFTTDANCVALWSFEDALTDSIGGNDLTDGGSAAYAADPKDGSKALDSEYADSDYLSRADADLDAGFPGKNGTTNVSFTVCAWVKYESVDASSKTYILSKFQAAGHRSFFCSVLVGTPNKWNLTIQNATTAEAIYMTPTNAITTGEWYHAAFVCDGLTGSGKVRVYDATNDVVDQATDATFGPLVVSDGQLEVGARQTMSYFLDGLLDEVVVFNRPLTDREIDMVRMGKFRRPLSGGVL